MTTGDDIVTNGQPLSWRDVYKAVNDSEVRVTAAITQGVAQLTTAMSDHEARIRRLETDGSPESREALRVANAALLKAEAAASAGLVINARGQGIMSVLSASQRFLLLLAGIIGASVAVINFVGDNHLV